MSGNLTLTYSYEDTINFFTNNYPNLIINVLKGEYIRFEDKEVEKICATNWGDVTGITKEQALSVYDFNGLFNTNNNIVYFNELKFFYNVSNTDFSNSQNLTEITIGAQASNFISNFSNCINLKSITFEESSIPLTIYGRSTNVPKLVKVVFPKRLYSFQNRFCGYCYNKRFLSTTPPINNYIDFNTYDLIFVPKESLDLYKTATNWSTYANKIYAYPDEFPIIDRNNFEYNMNISQKGSKNITTGFCLTPYISVSNCTQITISFQSKIDVILIEYDENKKFIDYWGGTSDGAVRSITLTGNTSTKFIIACFSMDRLEDSFIFDETNGKYLFIGENVK